jgi:C-methyltransferase
MVTTTDIMNKGRVLDSSDPGVAARYTLVDIFCGAWLSYAVGAIAEHGVADLLDETPLSCTDLAASAGLHESSLRRVLRALAANGIFMQTSPDTFAHNEASQLLRRDNPFSWRGLARMWSHSSCLTAWSCLPEVLRDGKSGIEHAFGKPLYDYLHEHKEVAEAFSNAMISNSAHPSLAIAKQFPFGQYQSVIDIGGGIGTLLVAVLQEHPQLVGALLEVQDLKDHAESYISHHGLAQRSSIIVGSFFERVPSGFDLYLVKNSLWNWSDEKCATIMSNVREAIGDKLRQKFIIIEYIINDENAPWTTLYDLQILNMPGGRARTLHEYGQLLERTGFALEQTQQIEDQTLLIANPV